MAPADRVLGVSLSGPRDRLMEMFHRSRDVRWALASQVVISGANFATTLILVRGLGLEGFGQFSVCFLLIMLVRNFLTAMVLTPMSAIGPRLRPVSHPGYRGFLAANALAFSLASSILLVVGAPPLAPVLLAPWLPGLALATAAANLTCSLSDSLRRYHFVFQKPARAFLVDAVRFAVQIAGLLLVPILMGSPNSPETALLVLAAGGIAGVCTGAFAYGPTRFSPRLWQITWPRHWNFIKWLGGSEIPEALQANLPYFVAAASLGEAQLGMVRAVQSIANLANLPLNALHSVAPAAISRAFVMEGRNGANRVLGGIYQAWSRRYLLIAAATLLIAGLVLPALLEIQTSPESVWTLALFLGLNLALFLRMGASIFLQALEVPAAVLAATAAGALVSILATWPLVAWLGPIGVPASFLTATVLIVGVTFSFVRMTAQDHP